MAQLVLDPQKLLSVVLDAIPTPVFFKDVDGRFLGCNRAYLMVQGLRREQVIGKTVYDLYAKELADTYTAADRKLIEAPHIQIYETQIEQANGVRLEVAATKSVFTDDEGRVLGLVGTFIDITEQRKAERSLRAINEHLELEVEERTHAAHESAEVLAATLESTADGILAVERNGRVVTYNSRFLTLWGFPEVVARAAPDGELLRLAAGRVKDPDEFIRRTREIYDDPLAECMDTIELADGRILERYSIGMRLDGEYTGRVWSFRDVTHERHLEAEMRHSQKMEAVGRLAGGVAHDFNNLLTVIMAKLAFVGDELEPNHTARHDLEGIRLATERAARLTEQLLAFSHKQVLSPRDVDLNEILQGMDDMLERLIGEDIQVKLVCEADLGNVSADPGQIEQVIANLCVNARDAMPEGGTLSLGTRNRYLDGPFVELSVSDTGMGMDEATRQRIFEPFFTTKERGKGTGLGLSTVYGIVQQSHGRIEVESAPGKGSTFRILLPRAEPAEIHQAVPVQSILRHPCEAVILLAEDCDTVREATKRQLLTAGYTVVEAVDGRHAIEVAAQYDHPFDLLLSDIIMPRLSGPDAAHEIMASGRSRRLLFMTGFDDNPGRLPPDVEVLRKPFTPEALLLAVQRALDIH